MIKKRTITAIILTALVIILTSNIWHSLKPVFVDFDIQSKGKCNIEVQLNRKDTNEFKKIKKSNENFDLDKIDHIKLKIKEIKKPKRIRIVIRLNENSNLITIKNIRINHFKFDNLKEMTVEGAKILKNDKELVLKPIDEFITITYPKTLNVKAGFDFDFEILIIIAVLTYLLVYKLLNYTAEFNTIQKKPKTEVIFLSVFFIFLFIPMSYIDNGDISKKENRTLAKLYPLINDDGQINYNFTKEFDAWFNDRFFLRKKFINLSYLINSIFSDKYQENKYVIYNKKVNFAYYKDYGAFHIILNDNLYSNEDLNKIKNNIYNLNEYCTKNNVKLYVMLSNDKESIYPEFYPAYYKRKNTISRLEQLNKTLSKIPKLQLVTPYKDLLNAKQNNLVYLRYDSHLNDTGSYVEYLSLMKKIEKSFPSVHHLTENDFEKYKIADYSGDCINHITVINKKKLKDEYIKFKLKKQNAKKVNVPSINRDFVLTLYENSKSNNKLRVAIIGDSFHVKYLDYLGESFNYVSSLFVGGGENYILDDDSKKTLFLNKPDILIIETTERFLNRFLYLDTFDNIFKGNNNAF